MNQEQAFDASGMTGIMRTNNRGGHRANAGRKPSGTRKQPLTLYIDESLMVGAGKNNLRNHIYEILKSFKNEQ
jgi:hypothetical protein